MLYRLSTLIFLWACSTAALACEANLDFTARPLLGKESLRLCDEYAGKVLLVVNTASKCAFTPQYEGLEKIHQRYRDRGFAVLGFPSNDFGNQEPGDAETIRKFCKTIYGVQFPMFEKTSVSAGSAHPFFDQLARQTGNYPKWNFHKYLIDRDGKVVADFSSFTKPQSDKLTSAIEKLL